jgi:hypothetical protein
VTGIAAAGAARNFALRLRRGFQQPALLTRNFAPHRRYENGRAQV